MKKCHYLIILFTGFILLGCDPDNSTKTKLFEEERSALEKAKAVESTIQQQTRQTQENADQQTQ